MAPFTGSGELLAVLVAAAAAVAAAGAAAPLPLPGVTLAFFLGLPLAFSPSAAWLYVCFLLIHSSFSTLKSQGNKP